MSTNDEDTQARRDLEREVLTNRMLALAEHRGSTPRVMELGEYLRKSLATYPERFAVALRIYEWRSKGDTWDKCEPDVRGYLEFLGIHVRDGFTWHDASLERMTRYAQACDIKSLTEEIEDFLLVGILEDDRGRILNKLENIFIAVRDKSAVNQLQSLLEKIQRG
ncbi:MAG: hypothetical protein ACD_81C00016G0002 [uncultured bacterium]|uniref:Uncharacterized protein n=1 Tax=Candidatus Wolfebacteria bacterium GW2011_GWC2_39_22 TaxID=1619013 RepID=A0A0G0RG73_9BACT|nr:MAG: hypothetical protein ACD_81C00016G0002 [uncultured bacterium]KKR12632.1 MAG: hypothetical protein UT41_C0001G0176 [Candidatus Wolfebacteria bacterium GW2011_GWC2_39_22]HBI25705.1 hypothetical protein [Candidatus Wolfebacteria bacterium]